MRCARLPSWMPIAGSGIGIVVIVGLLGWSGVLPVLIAVKG